MKDKLFFIHRSSFPFDCFHSRKALNIASAARSEERALPSFAATRRR
jgi:hypothetical protein